MALAAKEVTTKQVTGVHFGFYSDEEVKLLSVKRIVSPLVLDNLGSPILGGLYDPALGPIDQRGSYCSTCNLSATFCQGHFGHIELPLPVYNPLVFTTLYRLLKNTCFYCFHFKLGRDAMDRFVSKLSRLAEGDLVGAVSVNLKIGKNKDVSQMLSDLGCDSSDEGQGVVKPGAKRTPQAAPAAMTSTTLEAMREVLAEFFARVPKSSCANCGAISPNVKKQGHTKLFKVWPSSKSLIQNQINGVVVKSVLDSSDSAQAVAALETQMAAEMKGKSDAAKAARNRQRSASELGDSGDEAKEDWDDDKEADAVLAFKADVAEQHDEPQGVDESAASKKSKAKKAKAAVAAAAAAAVSGT